MFGISPDYPDMTCPNCHRPMVDMSNYEEAMQDGLSVGADSPIIVGMGRGRGVNPFAIGELINTLFDSILDFGRNKKAARLCREILPEFPKSQICPLCLFVYRRK